MTDTTTTPTAPRATGPRTEAGKAVSSRSAPADPEGATTHGLFCRQTVLPHLGEVSQAYQYLLDTLTLQLRPRNRLETQGWETDYPDEDALLTRLERLAHLQSGLRRQMDRAVRALCRDLPDLFARRTREDLMAEMHLTGTQARHRPILSDQLEHNLRANRRCPAPPGDLLPCLDNAPAHENCQNEPPPTDASSPRGTAPQ